MTSAGVVTGLDLNDEMLKAARELPLPPGGEIEWRQGSAQALPFDDGTFDVVVWQQGFQFFPDRIAALHHWTDMDWRFPRRSTWQRAVCNPMA